jgi:hypothetical protein
MLEQEFDQTVVHLLGEVSREAVSEAGLVNIKNLVSNLYSGQSFLGLVPCLALNADGVYGTRWSDWPRLYTLLRAREIRATSHIIAIVQ